MIEKIGSVDSKAILETSKNLKCKYAGSKAASAKELPAEHLISKVTKTKMTPQEVQSVKMYIADLENYLMEKGSDNLAVRRLLATLKPLVK